MRKDRDLSGLFAKGQQLETSLATTSLFSKDNGLHLMSYKISIDKKLTVIDNVSVYGKTILVQESKNYTMLQGDISKPFWKGKGTKRHFNIPNPIKQNHYHVKLLRLFLTSKGLSISDFVIQHYIIVPDTCKLEVTESSRSNILHKSELDALKRKLSFYNKTPSHELCEIIKGALF